MADPRRPSGPARLSFYVWIEFRPSGGVGCRTIPNAASELPFSLTWLPDDRSAPGHLQPYHASCSSWTCTSKFCSGKRTAPAWGSNLAEGELIMCPDTSKDKGIMRKPAWGPRPAVVGHCGAPQGAVEFEKSGIDKTGQCLFRNRVPGSRLSEPRTRAGVDRCRPAPGRWPDALNGAEYPAAKSLRAPCHVLCRASQVPRSLAQGVQAAGHLLCGLACRFIEPIRLRISPDRWTGGESESLKYHNVTEQRNSNTAMNILNAHICMLFFMAISCVAAAQSPTAHTNPYTPPANTAHHDEFVELVEAKIRTITDNALQLSNQLEQLVSALEVAESRQRRLLDRHDRLTRYGNFHHPDLPRLREPLLQGQENMLTLRDQIKLAQTTLRPLTARGALMGLPSIASARRHSVEGT